MDGQTDGQTDIRMDRPMDERMDSFEVGGKDNLDPRLPPTVNGIMIPCFLLFLIWRYGRTDRQTDRRMDVRTDGGTDQGSCTRLQVFVPLPTGFGTYFFDLSSTAVFTIFPFKIMSDPCPLRILILHGKCKNKKSKNMGTWQI